MGSEGWFDASKLLPGERMVRRGAARLRSESAPHWWEGVLVLTSERIVFLPAIDAAPAHYMAIWLTDVRRCNVAGRNRFNVAAADGVSSTFEVHDAPGSLRALLGRGARPWIHLVGSLRSNAHAQPAISSTPRRAAG